MIKLTYALRKRPDLSDAEFRRYWKDVHGPFVATLAKTVGAKRYVQSQLMDTAINDVLRQSRGHAIKPFDGVTEIWWDSTAQLRTGSLPALTRFAPTRMQRAATSTSTFVRKVEQ